MSNQHATFGREALRAESPADLLKLEKQTGRGERFARLDALTGNLLARMLNAEPVVAHERGREHDVISIMGLDGEQRALITEVLSPERQNARGAWFLPDGTTLAVGLVNLPSIFRHHPRFAMGIAAEARARVRLAGSADSVLVWAILEPLASRLFRPLLLRGPLLGKQDQPRQDWQDTERFLDLLGFDVSDALGPLRYGSGWGKLTAGQQLQAKQGLLHALAAQVGMSQAARYRALCLQTLISRYYEQADKGRSTRQRVLAKNVERVLAGFFGGDWLDFLAYLGEPPHPDDRIATALPEPRLVLADRDRVATVAAAQALPIAEIEHVLASFWGTSSDASPIAARCDTLRTFWQQFDEIHARQVPGNPPLWGLIEDSGVNLNTAGPYQPGLYRTLLSKDLLANMDRLWGTVMLPRWPERIVSALSPNGQMADAFGPALKFWHGCALTAWFICEGPYSRTDLRGLANYYQAELRTLERLGCPIDSTLFTDLMRAEAELGPPEPLFNPAASTQQAIAPGINLTVQMSSGTRRTGFQLLRDIISRHRQVWSARFLEPYLRGQWETEIREAAQAFNLLTERRGKPPTLKQFARHATVATNHWFGGDISSLYRMIGEKVPNEPQRHILLPGDRYEFAQSVFQALAIHANAPVIAPGDPEDRPNWNLMQLAEQSLSYTQLQEALDRPPTLTEFGRNKFSAGSSTLDIEIEAAWSRYQNAVALALRKIDDGTNAHPLGDEMASAQIANSAPYGIKDTKTAGPVTRNERRSLWDRVFRRR